MLLGLIGGEKIAKKCILIIIIIIVVLYFLIKTRFEISRFGVSLSVQYSLFIETSFSEAINVHSGKIVHIVYENQFTGEEIRNENEKSKKKKGNKWLPLPAVVLVLTCIEMSALVIRFSWIRHTLQRKCNKNVTYIQNNCEETLYV